MDTIFALASARGKAGVSVIRISGPESDSAISRMIESLPVERHAALRDLRWKGELLDSALVLRFAENASFTGEKTVEIQTHGSVSVVSAVLGVLGSIDGLRIAEPGEFTRRALENGRLDLSQVEGLADLIDAETEAQRKQALKVFAGAIGSKVAEWRRILIRAAALVEATIDFVDEDVPVDVWPEVRMLVAGLVCALRKELDGARVTERLRDGFEVAIVGPPNVGKSTLLNALSGRQAALTSEIAGTTRDIIEVRMDLDGLPVTFLDTAGMRETDDMLEKAGIDLAVRRAAEADIRVFLSDGDRRVSQVAFVDGDVVMQGKADLRDCVRDSVSGLTGQGIGALLDRILELLRDRVASSGTLSRARHAAAVAASVSGLEKTLTLLDAGCPYPEEVAEELRSAMVALESLVGVVNVESLLGEIFASFCVGK